jgi:hypothetical protein
MPRRSTPHQWALAGSYIEEVRQKSHGIIPRPDVVIAAVLILPRDHLRGGFLDRETLETLLAAALIQRLTLEGLPDLTLLHGILLSLLLGRREASRLSSSPILRNRWP